jgi:aspartate carbamoyltransferase regulatory subunit
MNSTLMHTLSVSAIKDGTVIDHIPSGQALKIIGLLKLPLSKQQVTIGLNLPSKRMGLKDLIKIENRKLSEQEGNQVAVFAPKATINLICDFCVERKILPSLPQEIERVLICPNHRCISRKEAFSHFFVEEFKNKIQLRCKFCEKLFERDDIRELCL